MKFVETAESKARTDSLILRVYRAKKNPKTGEWYTTGKWASWYARDMAHAMEYVRFERAENPRTTGMRQVWIVLHRDTRAEVGRFTTSEAWNA